MRKKLLLLVLVFSVLLAGCGSPEGEGTATPVADGDEEATPGDDEAGADETPTEEGDTAGNDTAGNDTAGNDTG